MNRPHHDSQQAHDDDFSRYLADEQQRTGRSFIRFPLPPPRPTEEEAKAMLEGIKLDDREIFGASAPETKPINSHE